MIEVPHYGLHWSEEGFAFLHQGRSSTNFFGLKKSSPFKVKTERPWPCNHLINVASPVPDPVQWANFMKYADDPLVQAMLPIPKSDGDGRPPLVYVEDKEGDLDQVLVLLSKMSTPISQTLYPIWNLKAERIMQMAKLTNVQPLVLVRCSPKEQKKLDVLTESAPFLVRSIVLTGNRDVVVRKPAERIETKLTASDLTEMMMVPWEMIGAMLLRRFARKEALFSPVEIKR